MAYPTQDMSGFNPGVAPERINDPHYLNLSKPISTPEADLSTKALLTGIGDVAGSAVKFADYVVREDVKDQIHAKVDEVQKDQTAAREQQLAQAQGRAYVAQRTDVTGKAIGPPALNIMDDNNQTSVQEVPSFLRGLPNMAAQIVGARANNKISETAYTGKLAAMQKDFRARYPGYRDWIDKVFEHATGVNPANAYMHNLTQDINTYAAASNSDRNKALSLAEQNSWHPDMANIARDIMAGKKGLVDVMVAIGPTKMTELNLTLRAAQRKDKEGTAKDDAEYAGKAMDAYGPPVIQSFLSAVETAGPDGSPIKALDRLKDHVSGRSVMTDDEGQRLGTAVMTTAALAKQRLHTLYHTPGPDGSPSYAQLYGEAETNAKIDAQATAITRIGELMVNKQYGPAFNAANRNAALAQDTLRDIYTDTKYKNLAGFYRLMAATTAAGGPAMVEKTFSYYQASMPNIQDEAKQYIQDFALKLSGQPELPNAPAAPSGSPKTGVPTTIKATIQDLQSPQKNIKDPQVYSLIIGEAPRVITDKDAKDQAKVNAIIGAFHPNNVGVVSLIKAGYTDEQGRRHPGQEEAFQTLTTRAVAEEVHRLNKTNPGVWEMYKNWTTQTFGNELFKKELLDLASYQTASNVQISWNTENHRWGVDVGALKNVNLMREVPRGYLPDRPFVSAGKNQLSYTQVSHISGIINRLNSGLESIKTVAQVDGVTNINQYLFSTMKALGYTPNTKTEPNGPEQIMNNLIYGDTPPPKPKTTP